MRTQIAPIVHRYLASGLLCASTVAVLAAAAPEAGARSTPTTRDGRYVTLGRLGVRATDASVTGRALTVRVRVRRTTELRLATARGTGAATNAWAKVVLRPGTHLLKARMTLAPRDPRMRLRVTARIGRVKAREFIPLKIVRPTTPAPATPPPASPAPVAPAPPAPTPEIPVPLPPANTAPTVAGARGSVLENSPKGTAVTTVVATDPDPGQSVRYTITSGNGLGAFAIDPVSGAITVADTSKLDFERTPTFTLGVRATDDGTPALSGEATVVVDVQDVADVPTASASATATSVAERRLASGSSPSGSSETATGTLTYDFGPFGARATRPFAWSTDVTGVDPDAPGAVPSALRSGGKAVTWTTDDSGLELTGTAGGAAVIRVRLTDLATRTAEVTLLGPLDHANPGRSGAADRLRLDVPFAVTDANDETARGALRIVVEDDAPVDSSVSTTPIGKTNLLLMLDTSGSTADPFNGRTFLDIQIRSAIELIKRYARRGDLAVRVVTYATAGTAQGTSWTTPEAAIAGIRTTTSTGNTNYAAALTAGMAAFASPGKLTGGENVAWFFGDGDPNPDSTRIDTTRQSAWESFLTTNAIDAFAIGTNPRTVASELAPIAYDGVAQAQRPAAVVSDPAGLPATLPVDELDPPPSLRSSGTLPQVPGADGARAITSVTVGGRTYTPSSPEVTAGVLSAATPRGATVTVALAGADAGRYTIDQTGAGNGEDTLEVEAEDRDGDVSTNTLRFGRTDADAPPLTRDDLVISNVEGATATLEVPHDALLRDDAGGPLTLTSVEAPTGLVATNGGSSVTLTDAADGGGTFDYVATDSSGRDDTARVRWVRTTGTTLTGSGFREILIGRPTADTVNAGAGDDELIGGAGDDLLRGGAGDDTIRGGPGSDRIVSASRTDGTDTVLDFDGDPTDGQDVLDLTALAVPADRVRVVDLGSTVEVLVNADTSDPDFELRAAVLRTDDPVTVGEDVIVAPGAP